jgi:long-chain acyl-CoA synthetase
MLSYLPLAHSFERSWVEAASLVDGNTHLFFAESLDTFMQDLQRARPTLFISVPRLWLKFQQGVFAKMPPAKLDRLLRIPILGKLVARKVLKGLGLDAVIAGRQRLGADPGGPDPLVPRWACAVRRLRHDRGQLLLARLQRRSSAPGYVGVPCPACRCASAPRARS